MVSACVRGWCGWVVWEMAGVVGGWADEWRAVLVFVCGVGVWEGVLFNRQSSFSNSSIETRVTRRSRKAT